MFSAVFPAQYTSLGPISVLVRDYAQRAGFDNKQLYDIELAVDEACSNIIDHAYPTEQKGEMLLEMELDDKGITIMLQDQGQSFNPQDVPSPDLVSDVVDRRERGLGVFLIHQLMDFVHYEALDETTNQLTMRKLLVGFSDTVQIEGIKCRDSVLTLEALQLVSEINRSISSIVDLNELLAKVSQLIHQRLDYPYVHLFLFDYVPQKLVFVSGSGSRAAYYAEKKVTYDLNAHRGLIPLAAKSGRLQLANDVGNTAWHQSEAQSGTSIGSELSLPLQFRGETLGVLDVQSDQLNAFQENDVNLLESLSITISVAIRNAQLFKAQEWRREVSESYRETADLLTRDLKLEELLTAVLKKIPQLLPVDFCALCLIDPESQELMLEAQFLANDSQDSDFPGTPKVLAKENWFHHANLDLESILKPAQPALDQIAAALGMDEPYSAIAAPIVSEGKKYGVLTIHTDSQGRYGTDSLKICSTYADYFAYAIDKERLRQIEELRRQTEQELNLARRIQQTFLPETLPQIPGYDLAVEWKTARQVGGDFYDVIQLDEQRYGLLIADVSDKGLPASLYMTVARTLLRAVARDFTSPAETLTRVNQLLQLDSSQSFFVTLFYMILDVKTGQLLCSIAGHTPPIYLQPQQNQAHSLGRGGIALGIMDPIQLKDDTLQIDKGEAFFLYTDGVSETRNSQNEEYGTKRLEDLLRDANQKSARSLIELVMKDLEEYSGFSALEDDCTMLVLKRK